ncbi:hypothetical protein JCM3775_006347 [Rhodotorula graminis]
MHAFTTLSRTVDPTRIPHDRPLTPTLPTRLARGGATPVVFLSPSARSSSSGLTYQDVAPTPGPASQLNPFALEGQAKRAADQALLLAARQRQPAPGAPASAPFGLPPSAFSHQYLGAPAAPGPLSSTFLPPSRHPSLVSLADSGDGVAPRSTHRRRRQLLDALLPDRGRGSSASSAAGHDGDGDAGKENVEPVRRASYLAAPAAAAHLEPATPKRQRIRVAEWRDQVHRAASVEEGTSAGEGASRVDESAARQGAVTVGAAAGRPAGKAQESRAAQAQPRRTAGERQQGKEGNVAEGEEDGERARQPKKTRQRRRPNASTDQRARSPPSSTGGGAGRGVSGPKRRSGRTQRASEPAPAAADETGVSTLDLVAMLPRRAKRFGRRGGLSSQDEGDEDEDEDEDVATDYDDLDATSKRKAKQRKPATRSRKTVAKAPAGKTRRRVDASGGSDDSAAHREKEAKRRKWADIDAYELEIVPTL